MEKYKRQEVSPVEEENERDETYQASNPQIDTSRTYNNYHVMKTEGSYLKSINTRIKEFEQKRKIKDDAVLMCSFILGSDREFFDDLSTQEMHRFFYDVTVFFTKNI